MNQNNGQPNTLNMIFYSERCQVCYQVLTLLKNFNIINNFKLIKVDGQIDKVPKGITRIPTMFVQGINKPLVGGPEIFEWLKAWHFMMRQKAMQQNQIKANMMKIMMTNMKNKGPLGFSNSEMNSFSDNFALSNNDMPLPQSFQGYGDEDKNSILTFPEAKDKLSKDEVTKRIRDIEKQRDTSEEQFKDSMQKKQLAKIYEEYINTGEFPK